MNDAEKSKLEQKLKEAAPVLNRLGDGPSVLPDHVRARLNSALDKKFPLAAQQAAEEPAAPTPVHRTAVEQQKAEPSWLEVWRWWVGLATATAAVALIVVLNQSGPDPKLPPVIQIAMLDSVGATRGAAAKSLALIQQTWKEAKTEEFSDAGKTKRWQQDWSTAGRQPVVKVLYDRDARVIKVIARIKSRSPVEAVFPINDEQQLSEILTKVTAFVREQSQ